MADTAVDIPSVLPVEPGRRNSVGWWGVACLIATEGSLFAYLLFSYFYIAVQRGAAFSPEPHPSISLSGPNTLILLSSSLAVWWGEGGVKRGDKRRAALGIGGALLLGLIFLGVQIFEWNAKRYGIPSGAYGSLFFVITGFHMAHVVVGALMLGLALTWSVLGRYGPHNPEPVSVISTYWHFVDVVWLAVFSTFYISPYLIGGAG